MMDHESKDPGNVTPIRPEMPAPEEIRVRSMFSDHYDDRGGAHFSYSNGSNLIELMGLLRHAEKNIDMLWFQNFGSKIVKP